MDFLKKLLNQFWLDNKDKLFEATKAATRYLIFLVLSWSISYFSELPQSETTLIGLSLLTFIDKYLHESWKSRGRTGLKGISPF